jgi:hypothetical protein
MNTGAIRYYHCTRLWLAQSFYCEVTEADLLSNHLIAKAKHTIIDCGPQANAGNIPSKTRGLGSVFV